MLTLRDIDDPDWPLYWQLHVLPRLQEIGNRAQTPWLPERIRKALESGRAHLFADGDSFCVLRPRIDSGAKVVEVWAAYGKRGNEIRAHEAQARELARSVGASHIQFWTVLPALNALAWRRGYQWHRNYNQFTIWRVPL